MDFSSERRFSTGVPVRAARRCACRERAARDCAAAGFLMFCASSSARYSHVTPDRSARSRCTRAYVVTRRSTSLEELLERLAARAARAVVHDDAKLRREALGLADPVLGDGRGADEERRADAFARVARREQRREELDRLAEAHVVRETRAEAAREQEAQPADAAHLIGAQRARQAVRRGVAGDLASARPPDRAGGRPTPRRPRRR